MKPIDQLSDDEWAALLRHALSQPDAPAHLVQQALDLWRRRPPAAAPGTPLLARFVAALAFDSWSVQPLAAGMRALPSQVRQLLFTAEACDIDLRVAPAGTAYELSGQLLGAPEVLPASLAGRVEVRPFGRGEPTLYAAALDDCAEFRFPGLVRGTYQVTLHLDRGEIALPLVEIGPRRAGPP